jgi:hypothetical protein
VGIDPLGVGRDGGVGRGRAVGAQVCGGGAGNGAGALSVIGADALVCSRIGAGAGAVCPSPPIVLGGTSPYRLINNNSTAKVMFSFPPNKSVKKLSEFNGAGEG